MPVLNAADTLPETLEALAAQRFDLPWELVVVDNGSVDASMAVARSFAEHLRLRLVDGSDERGSGHARNVGVAHARAARLAFVDADDVVADGWLRIMYEALEQHPVVASRFDGARLNAPEVRAQRRLPQEHGLHPYLDPPFLPHAGGSGLAVRREAHEAIGGFDPRFRRLQDTDYAWRLQLAGYPLHFEPCAVLHVRFRTGAGASMRQAFQYGRFDGYLYGRYRAQGMGHVPYPAELRRLLRAVARLPRAAFGPERVKRLRHVFRHGGRLLARTEIDATRATRRLRRVGRRWADDLSGVTLGTVIALDPRYGTALTFDDGPHPEVTPRLLALLHRHRVKATFFLLGSAAARHPDLVRRIREAGHAVGSHTFDHDSLPALPARARRQAVRAGHTALAPHAGPLFRPPFGHQSAGSWWTVVRAGLQPVAWSGHAFDWQESDADTLTARLRAVLRPGAIVLLHDAHPVRGARGREAMLQALDTVLGEQAGRQRFVTVEEAVRAGRVRRAGWWKRPGAQPAASRTEGARALPRTARPRQSAVTVPVASFKARSTRRP